MYKSNPQQYSHTSQFGKHLSKQYEAVHLQRQNYNNIRDTKFVDPSKLQKFYDVDLGVERRPKFSTIGNAQPANATLTAGAQRRQVVDNVAGPVAGIAGAAALLNPAIAPVAAAAGIGYGVFKLGEGLKIW